MDKSLQFVKFHLIATFLSHICVNNIFQSSRGDQTVGNFTKVDRDDEKMDMSNSDNDDSFINNDEDVMSRSESDNEFGNDYDQKEEENVDER